MNQIPACAVAVFLGLATPAVADAGLYKTAVVDVDHSRKSETIDVPARGKTFEVDEPTPSQPAGCEAAASLIADPTLARLVGRCFA